MHGSRPPFAGWIVLTVSLIGCGAKTPAAEGDEPPSVEEQGCDAGELLVASDAGQASCLAAGITTCAEGFVSDEAGGCLAVLPELPCPAGQMALVGETACRAVAPCGDDTWGDIPVDANTEHVDASFTGVSDGSATAPHATIAAAVAASAPGAIVAIAAGTYPETVTLSGKPVTLWGRCPDLVTIGGSGATGQQASILILGGADGAVVRDLAITGDAYGVASSGSLDVVLERVWVHDVADRGIDVENIHGDSALTVRDSLVEGATGLAFFSIGSALTIERSEVRGTAPGAGASGRAISARGGSLLTVTDSHLHDHHDQAILLSGSTGVVARTLIGDTLGSPGAVSGGITIQRDSATLEPSAMTIEDVIVERSANFGILVEGSSASLDRVVVRDTQPIQDAVDFGAGLQIQGHPTTGDPASVTVNASVFERNRYGAISVTSGNASVWSTILRDTAPLHGTDELGRGALAFYDADLGLPAALELVGSVVSGNHEAGVFVQGGTLVMDQTRVTDTRPTAAGIYGRGLVAQAESSAMVGSDVAVVDSLFERNHELGVYVEGSTASLVSSTVSQTIPRPIDGLFGDGVHVDTAFNPLPGLLSLEGSTVTDNARVGVGTLGAVVRLSASTVSCNPIALNGQANMAGDFTIEDLGGNDCSCESDEACKVSTQQLTPPDPLGLPP